VPRRLGHRELSGIVAGLRAGLRHCRRELERVRVEDDVLREAAAPLIHGASARERFAFIHARRGRFGLRRLCRILVADSANYQAWIRAAAGRGGRDQEELHLTRLVAEAHTAHPAHPA
jgi:hypothetical protein